MNITIQVENPWSKVTQMKIDAARVKWRHKNRVPIP
jgi:hypothetical protein